MPKRSSQGSPTSPSQWRQQHRVAQPKSPPSGFTALGQGRAGKTLMTQNVSPRSQGRVFFQQGKGKSGHSHQHQQSTPGISTALHGLDRGVGPRPRHYQHSNLTMQSQDQSSSDPMSYSGFAIDTRFSHDSSRSASGMHPLQQQQQPYISPFASLVGLPIDGQTFGADRQVHCFKCKFIAEQLNLMNNYQS